jgi:predicted transposase/invertase (TIGR01784 family)
MVRSDVICRRYQNYRLSPKEKQGKTKGVAEGEVKGETKGVAKGIQKVAGNMLLKGMPSDQIAEVTGPSEQEIQALRDSITH